MYTLYWQTRTRTYLQSSFSFFQGWFGCGQFCFSSALVFIDRVHNHLGFVFDFLNFRLHLLSSCSFFSDNFKHLGTMAINVLLFLNIFLKHMNSPDLVCFL